LPKFFIGSGSDWNTDANWSTTSGVSPDTTFPNAADDAKFDANSGNCTLDALASCLSLDFTGYTGTFDQSTFTFFVDTGGIIFASGMTYIGGAAGTLDITDPSSLDFSALGTLTLNATHQINLNSGSAPQTLTINFGTHTYGKITFKDDTNSGSGNVGTFSIAGSGAFTVQGDFDITEADTSAIVVTFAAGASPTLKANITSTVGTVITLNAGSGTWTVDTTSFTITLPTFNGDTSTWIINENINISGVTTFNGQSSRFRFVKQSANQNLTSGGNKFNEVEITSLLGTVFLDIFKAAKLIANSSDSPQIIFEELVTHEVDALDLTGSDANRITLKSNLPGTQWKLLVLGNQVVNHVKVKDSDASLSTNFIKAIIASDDDGNNLNWQFGILDTQRILYDYGEALRKTTRILYDYIKFIPDNVRIIFNPYSQDSVRIDWSEFVPPAGYTGDIFYSVYVDGEAYEVDIDGSQTWIDLVGLVNLEDIIVDVVIQSRFGERFTFDYSSIGDRIKILFTESGDPNIARYVIFRDDGAGNIDLTKEFGEIIIKDRQDILNTSFVPESS